MLREKKTKKSAVQILRKELIKLEQYNINTITKDNKDTSRTPKKNIIVFKTS